MDRYQLQDVIGDGTYGRVWKAINKSSGGLFAVKKLKKAFVRWEEALQSREITSLRRLQHSNLIRLYELVREKGNIYLVFEYLDGSLLDEMRRRQEGSQKGATSLPSPGRLAEEDVKAILQQCLHGLAYMHGKGYLHRDIKPENILCRRVRERGSSVATASPASASASPSAAASSRMGSSSSSSYISPWEVKIADLGLARPQAEPPSLTPYIATRWYRAPEIALLSKSYGPAVDVFALSAVCVEALCGSPLLPGSSQLHQSQLLRDFLLVKESRRDAVAEKQRQAKKGAAAVEERRLPLSAQAAAVPAGLRPATTPEIASKLAGLLSSVTPPVSGELLELLARMLLWDPAERPSAAQALLHPALEELSRGRSRGKSRGESAGGTGSRSSSPLTIPAAGSSIGVSSVASSSSTGQLQQQEQQRRLLQEGEGSGASVMKTAAQAIASAAGAAAAHSSAAVRSIHKTAPAGAGGAGGAGAGGAGGGVGLHASTVARSKAAQSKIVMSGAAVSPSLLDSLMERYSYTGPQTVSGPTAGQAATCGGGLGSSIVQRPDVGRAEHAALASGAAATRMQSERKAAVAAAVAPHDRAIDDRSGMLATGSSTMTSSSGSHLFSSFMGGGEDGGSSSSTAFHSLFQHLDDSGVAAAPSPAGFIAAETAAAAGAGGSFFHSVQEGMVARGIGESVLAGGVEEWQRGALQGYSGSWSQHHDGHLLQASHGQHGEQPWLQEQWRRAAGGFAPTFLSSSRWAGHGGREEESWRSRSILHHGPDDPPVSTYASAHAHPQREHWHPRPAEESSSLRERFQPRTLATTSYSGFAAAPLAGYGRAVANGTAAGYGTLPFMSKGRLPLAVVASASSNGPASASGAFGLPHHSAEEGLQLAGIKGDARSLSNEAYAGLPAQHSGGLIGRELEGSSAGAGGASWSRTDSFGSGTTAATTALGAPPSAKRLSVHEFLRQNQGL